MGHEKIEVRIIPGPNQRGDPLRCSFCGKPQDKVIKLIAGPKVYICNECIDICNKIMADDRKARDLS